MKDPVTEIITAGLVVIKEKKLLLAFSRNKRAWYLPGGKALEGENTVSAILREIREELNVKLDGRQLRFYMHISAPAFGEDPAIIMEQDCFLCNRKINPLVSAEIGECRYFSREEYAQEPAQVPGVLILFEKLKQDRLIY